MASPVCECKSTPGYSSLHDRLNKFVCCFCWKPTWMVYDKSHKTCEECGVSFFSPWEVNCRDCNTELLNLANEVEDPQDKIEIMTRVSDPWDDWVSMRDDAIARTKFLGFNGRWPSTHPRG